MKQVQFVPRKHVLASALLLAMAGPAFAQDANTNQGATGANTTQDATDLDTIQVTGIRGSLTSSMNLKRDAQGVVDGIVAEDIGKFPDSNLAESLQRISGVSIDRSNGEGSRVTVRGMGPDFNLVLLNGRQMPTSTGSRAFEFSDLASESISQVDVYKIAEPREEGVLLADFNDEVDVPGLALASKEAAIPEDTADPHGEVGRRTSLAAGGEPREKFGLSFGQRS